ncbi:hypothetical protein FRB96_004739 [Tulasnella sp. 330]|nr:hypothetical protein FRB96_004739 [Tulasnella sp. 330]KAG8876777.1 hypothetical protein FRB97_003928 [Tulasnella sp. 331]KAG8882039.1 hypothetical protein FRB98_003957 [Tulasnella sp. 332]
MTPTILKTEYVDDLQQHILHIQRHANGIDEALWGPDDLPHTIFPPGIVWTPEEKGLFFHALTRHSRFRPDLIASCIQTKSAVDVSLYLDALEAARGDEMSSREAYELEADSLVFEASVEAHGSLIAFEEKQSSKIINIVKRKESEVWQASAKRAAQNIDELDDGLGLKEQRRTSFGDHRLSWKLLIAAHKVVSAKYYPPDQAKNKQRGAESIRLLRERKLQGQVRLLRAAGLTEESLGRDGMDIFRLDRLAFLSKAFYTNLIPDAGNDKKSKLNLTYSFLELIRSRLLYYLVGVIHHAISIAEVHVESRQGTKSFGHVSELKEVSVQHVQEAVKLIGQTWTRNSFLESLPGRLGLDLIDFNSDGQEVILKPLVSPAGEGANVCRSDGAPSMQQRDSLELKVAWFPPQFVNEDSMDSDKDSDFGNEEEKLLKVLDGEKEIENVDVQLDKATNTGLRRRYRISKKKWKNEKKEKFTPP